MSEREGGSHVTDIRSRRGCLDTQSVPLLEAKALSVTYFRQTGTFIRRSVRVDALVNISFAVREHEVLSVIGETGSGKSTIARSILRLVKPTSGFIKFRGDDVQSFSGRELHAYRQKVQMIFQDPYESLNPLADIFTIVSTPMRCLLGVKDGSELTRMTRTLLEEVGLDPALVMNKYPHQLSGGEGQRVNIARALAPNPELLVADEPITMLDAEQRMSVMHLLAELREKRKLAIFLITHEMGSARFLSDNTIVIYRGRLVERGKTSDVISRPFHPYVELIMNATPKLQNSGRSIRQVGSDDLPLLVDEDSQNTERGCVFRALCKYATSVCAEIEPEAVERSPNHLVACHNPLNQK
jgi:oligopeptide/dipeptide ABC transporter ATP-binding protein